MTPTVTNSSTELNNSTDTDRRKLDRRLKAAGITEPYVAIEAGTKRSAVDHTKPENQYSIGAIDGTYGVMPADRLGFIDIDVPIDELPEPVTRLIDEHRTFTVKSPHGGEHHYYAIDGAPSNSTEQWGELRTDRQYVIGAGSTIDHAHCGDCGCSGEGRYEVIDDRPIATIDAADLEPITDQTETRARDTCEIEPDDVQSTFDGTTAGRLGYAIQRDEKFAQLYYWACRKRSLAGFAYSDRSRAECALAQKLLWWFEHDVGTVRDILDTIRPPKWDREGPGYRASVLRYGLAYSAGIDEKYDPERMSGVCRRHALDVSVVLGITDEPVSTANIIDSELVDVEKDQVRKVLNALNDDGFIHYEKDGRSGAWIIDELPGSEHRFFHQFPTQADIDQQRRNWAVSD